MDQSWLLHKPLQLVDSRFQILQLNSLCGMCQYSLGRPNACGSFGHDDATIAGDKSPATFLALAYVASVAKGIQPINRKVRPASPCISGTATLDFALGRFDVAFPMNDEGS